MLNVSVASYLAYTLDKRTCVIDTVGGYRNISWSRKDEVERLKENPDNEISSFLSGSEYQNLLSEPLLGSRVHIYTINVFENFLEFLRDYKDSYDYLFLDLSGLSKENFHFIMKSHFIFLVSSLDDLNKDKRTYNAFNFAVKKKTLKFNLEKIAVVVNHVPKSEDIDDKLTLLTKQRDISIVDNIIYERKSFNEYSTVNGLIDVSDEIKMFCEEIVELIGEDII